MKEYNLELLFEKYQTPLYVFDIDQLKDRVHYLRSSLPKRVELCYAMKANPFLVKELENVVDKLEVCSPGEYYICENQQIAVDKLVISGVYKTPSAIEDMLENGTRVFTIESMSQFDLLANLALKFQVQLKLLLRLTSGNQFGMSKEEIQEIVHKQAQYPLLDIYGIQYFSGTQKTSIKKLKKECDLLDELIVSLKQKEDFEVKELEFGPGFPVLYFEEGKKIDEDAFLMEFSDVLNDMTYQGPITLELGRSIAAGCGQYMTSVVDMKTNQNGHYAILDGGMHHMAYYGQMMAMKHPYHDVYPKREEKDSQIWNLCGSLCTVNDLIVKQLPVTDLKIGDVFIFKNTGAYSMTEGISLFLSRDLPSVLFYKNGTYEQAREPIPTFPLNCQFNERRR